MSDYRPDLDLVTMPNRIRRLPVHRGYPVPWFVEWVLGVPEFRVMSGARFREAIQQK